MQRIGIARGLHSYHHFPLWRTFFTELGCEVVLSGPTDKKMVEQGVKLAPAELCLPVKVFLGQVAQLLEQADVVLVPRLVCRRLNGDFYFGCPKAIALPDLVRAVFSLPDRVVELVVDHQRGSDEAGFVRCAQELGFRRASARAAFASAQRAEQEAKRLLKQGATPADFWTKSPVSVRQWCGQQGEKIGVIGHPYLVYDDYISLNLLKMLTETGAEPVVPLVTVEDLKQEAAQKNALNWFYELELIARARRLVSDSKVRGIIMASSFACGTAPVVNEVIRREVAGGANLPMLTLLFDEHSAEIGLRTRVESFVDLLRAVRIR
jgi:predicted nucleotide-binding protein (sugar kinase/HSP70/actin superfamily)